MTAKVKKISERISLLPVAMPGDEDFLKAVYGSTRDDVKYLPFDDAGKQAFILMQYAAQKKHYDEYYANAEHYIISYEGKRAGRFMLELREDEIRLIDIAILPSFRGSGVGTAVLEDAQLTGAERGLKCTLHVIRENPSIRLYERLGFVISGENGIHHKMEWLPPAAESSRPK